MSYKDAFHPDYARGTMWVLHRLLGHHPTNPNLRQCQDIDEDVIRAMLWHRTYTSRICSYAMPPHEEMKRLVEWLTAILAGIETCPFCGRGWEGPLANVVLMSKEEVMASLPKWKKRSRTYLD